MAELKRVVTTLTTLRSWEPIRDGHAAEYAGGSLLVVGLASTHVCLPRHPLLLVLLKACAIVGRVSLAETCEFLSSQALVLVPLSSHASGHAHARELSDSRVDAVAVLFVDKSQTKPLILAGSVFQSCQGLGPKSQGCGLTCGWWRWLAHGVARLCVVGRHLQVVGLAKDGVGERQEHL